MEDRVGEVLARRAALDSGIGLGLVLSIFLHAAITAAAVWAAMHQAPPQMANVLSIRFAPMTAAASSEQRVASRPALPTPPKPPAPQPKPKEEPVEVPVTATTPPAKAEKKSVPFSPFGKSTKKGSEHAAAPALPPPTTSVKPGVANAADVPVGGAGVTGLEGGDFPYTIYLQRMWLLIGNHWSRPQVPPGTTAVVHFIVDRDGTIHDVRLETPGGNDTFDRNAQRAILETSPLPPLPYGYAGTYLGVQLTFK